jgi:hypothetical protein
LFLKTRPVFENKRNSHPAKRKSSGPCFNVAGGFLAGTIGSFWSRIFSAGRGDRGGGGGGDDLGL